MLSNTLNTNEVKDASGTEVEFQHLEQIGRTRKFAQITESSHPSLQYRLTLSHNEIGVGIKLRRRSLIRFDKMSLSGVDAVTPVVSSFYMVGDFPVGALTSMDEPKAVIANGMSFLASLGANTTILYDCTGNGGLILVNGLL